MMKTLISLLMSFLLLGVLTACSQNESYSSEHGGSAEPSAGNWGGQSDESSAGDSGASPAGSPQSDSNEADTSEPDPIDPDAEPDEESPTWIQLSTDDSTSMASAQMYKAGFQWRSLKAHEFINYYDAPAGMFAEENWAVDGTVGGDIDFGLKADLFEVPAGPMIDCDAGEDCEDSSPYNVAEVFFQMKSPMVDHNTRRNWNIFLCVDVSGSMGGDNIKFVRDSLTTMMSHFKEGDVITLVTFDSDYHDIFLNWEFSSNENAIREAFQALAPGSSTNMIAGLDRVYDLAQENFDENKLQRVILFGDGNANVGNTELDHFNGLTRINGQEGIYLSGVGVGTNYDWDRMDQLTDAGKGAHVFLPNSQEVDLIFGDYFTKLVEVAADRISIEMELPAGVVLESFTGEEVSTNPEERLQNIILAAGDDMTFIARFRINREEALNEPASLKLTLRPLSSGSEVVHEVSVDALSDLVQAPGALFERTRMVRDFATVVTGSDTTGTNLEDISSRLAEFGPLDWGLQEIQSLVD
jgi:Ca-activated chloride channel homolog